MKQTHIGSVDVSVCPCDSYLVDLIHPIAGELKHQLAGLHRCRHGAGDSDGRGGGGGGEVADGDPQVLRLSVVLLGGNR